MLHEEELERLLLRSTGWQRFTQDSPIFPDVWFGYRGRAFERQDLLLEPHYRSPSGLLARSVRERLAEFSTDHQLAYAGEYVAVRLTLPELLTAVLPLSNWWRSLVRPRVDSVFEHLEEFVAGKRLAPDGSSDPLEVPPPDDELQWLLTIAGRLLTDTSDEEARDRGFGDVRRLTGDVRPITDEVRRHTDDVRRLTGEVLAMLGHPDDHIRFHARPLWSVSRNRRVKATVWRSRETIKADAASRVFPAATEGLAWAVIDSGIDATHPAFRRREGGELVKLSNDFTKDTIVRATFDFTDLRRKLATAMLEGAQGGAAAPPPPDDHATATVRDALVEGLAIDWRGYEPLIRLRHVRRPDGSGYRPPRDPHGTHVAGTIAGDWRPTDPVPRPRHPLQGICPGLMLYDLRVLDDNGVGNEFDVLAALSYVRWRNAQSGGIVIHGVNLSFALEHNVLNSACGRSPVCLEAERVHNAGVVVVAAAGNDGRAEYRYRGHTNEGYRTVSITDPGNTEVAITVGSTHRLEPHAYGVSYFSSRGPTGDGRAKPDIVAPGEKITAPVPQESSARMDGTSMAAPHVSGAAALLMARHRELVGQPTRVKRILCDTATDLGREPYYQGRGIVDVLRALQSV